MDSKFRTTLGKLNQWLNIPLAILGFVYLIVYAVQVSAEIDADTALLLETASWAIYSIFALDLMVRLLVTQNLLLFLKTNWLEIIALVVPFMRALRVLRIVVAIRGIRPLLKSRMTSTATYLALLLPLTWFIGGVAVLDAEKSVTGSHITNLADALWWSLATITTVGYGDLYPISAEGKGVAAIIMLLGIALFSTCAGILASWIMSERKE